MRVTHLLCIGLLAATSAAAQDTPAVLKAEAACGPFSQNFIVKTSGGQDTPKAAERGKARIYVIEDWDPVDRGRINRPTVRTGMDGQWMGATQGDSWLSFSADPGQRHLCVNWKSGLGAVKNLVALYGLDAKAGETYYFRASFRSTGAIGFALTLDPLNVDEARLLLAQYPRATWSEKK